MGPFSHAPLEPTYIRVGSSLVRFLGIAKGELYGFEPRAGARVLTDDERLVLIKHFGSADKMAEATSDALTFYSAERISEHFPCAAVME